MSAGYEMVARFSIARAEARAEGRGAETSADLVDERSREAGTARLGLSSGMTALLTARRSPSRR